jgi:hypothetical protein
VYPRRAGAAPICGCFHDFPTDTRENAALIFGELFLYILNGCCCFSSFRFRLLLHVVLSFVLLISYFFVSFLFVFQISFAANRALALFPDIS